MFVGAGYNYNASMNNNIYCYGFAQSVEKDSCYVYEFRSYGLGNSSQAAFSGFYPVKTPEALNAESCFASSLSYNGILFYAAGNKVYRFDFIQTGGKATPIYTHAGGKATVMKFANKAKVDEDEDFSAYEHELSFPPVSEYREYSNHHNEYSSVPASYIPPIIASNILLKIEKGDTWL